MKRQGCPWVIRQLEKSLQLAHTITESASWTCGNDKEECGDQARICALNPGGVVWASCLDKEQWFLYCFCCFVILFAKNKKFSLWPDCIPLLKLLDGHWNLPLQRCSWWRCNWNWLEDGFSLSGCDFPVQDTIAFTDRRTSCP